MVKKIYFAFFWLCHEACGTLVPPPRTEPRPTAVKALRLNHWTTKEFLLFFFKLDSYLKYVFEMD